MVRKKKNPIKIEPWFQEVLKSLDEEILALTIDQIRTFLATAEQESAGKAALVLKRQQSSIMKQLSVINKHLEVFTGMPVIVGSKHAELTAVGQDFEKYARRILDVLVEAARELKREKYHCSIRVGIQHIVLISAVEVINAFESDSKDRNIIAECHISQLNHEEIYIALEEKRVDFVFGAFLMQEQEEENLKLPQSIGCIRLGEVNIGLASNYEITTRKNPENTLQEQKNNLHFAVDCMTWMPLMNEIFSKSEIPIVGSKQWEIFDLLSLMKLKIQDICFLTAEHFVEDRGEGLNFYSVSPFKLHSYLFFRNTLLSYPADHPFRHFIQVSNSYQEFVQKAVTI